MATIRGLRNRIAAFDAQDAAATAIANTADALTEQNRQQMLHGKTSTGAQIGEYKNEAYAQMKFEKNPLAGFGNKDLNLTGDFQNGMVTSVVGNAVITESTDPKNTQLTGDYGDTIFGLGGPYKAAYITADLRPAWNNLVFIGTGLKPNRL